MPIESPNLDDLDFDTLERLLRDRIPIYAPEWTDHNDSDPGITLVQLFAYLAEQIGYRLNQVPDKNYIEFLKLIGIRLRPAEPARTTLSFVMTQPETEEQFLIRAGARVKAKSDADEPPVFETDTDVDVLPAQFAALVATQSADLRQINASGETGPTALNVDPDGYISDRFSLFWDGKTPKQKDMPTDPVPMFHRDVERQWPHLWVGLAFNPAVTAGFLGARVNLTLQLDDDEQPASDAVMQCGEPGLELEDLTAPDTDLVTYRYYRPPQLGETTGTWQDLTVLGDDTQGWIQSGQVRFDVPQRIGAVPDAEWENVEADLAHPLVGALKKPIQGAPDLVPVSGWIGVEFHRLPPPAALLRALSFNVVSATNAETVANEQLGPGTGDAGQRVTLANDNVLPETVDLVTVGPDPAQEVRPWTLVDGFDKAGPQSRVYVLDPESGEIVFGDGLLGQPPAKDERLVVRSYRHGGGKDAEVDVGLVNQPESLPAPVEAAFNIVAARGGKDAEKLNDAKDRAPRELKTQERAVTAGDFEFLTLQTRGVRVSRAVIVPLRVPYPEGSYPRVGLDLDNSVPGAVSVIVVPDEEGLYPTPTRGMLRTVCKHLDQYRLITTEIYTTVPQYVRIFDLDIDVKAAPGFTRTDLRDAIAGRLESYFHVLPDGDGSGFPFGTTVHHADLVAQVFHVKGVDRVERLEGFFDGNTPDGVTPVMTWRMERSTPRRLTNCAGNETDDEKIELAVDETVFIDTSTLNINVMGD